MACGCAVRWIDKDTYEPQTYICVYADEYTVCSVLHHTSICKPIALSITVFIYCIYACMQISGVFKHASRLSGGNTLSISRLSDHNIGCRAEWDASAMPVNMPCKNQSADEPTKHIIPLITSTTSHTHLNIVHSIRSVRRAAVCLRIVH